MEKSLVFVKPKNEDIAYAVFDYLNQLLTERNIAFRKFPMTWELSKVNRDIISKHYSHVRKFGETIFERTIEAYIQGKMFLTFYEGGKGIVDSIRKCIGETDPVKAEDWTVRGHFRRDSLEQALAEKRYLNNVIHASKTSTDAQREMALWMPVLADLES